jgi:hypothetical protein
LLKTHADSYGIKYEVGCFDVPVATQTDEPPPVASEPEAPTEEAAAE